MLKIVALICALAGGLLLLSPETLAPPTSTNTILVFARDNNLLVGVILLGLAYFIFMRHKESHSKQSLFPLTNSTDMTSTAPAYSEY